MLKKIFNIISIFIIMVIIFSNSVFAVTGTITGNNVRIRENADINSKVITAVIKNEKVNVIGEDGDWYQVKVDNFNGYISKEYVETEFKAENDNETEENTNMVDENINSTSVEERNDGEKNDESIVNKNYEINQKIVLNNDVELRYLPNFTSRILENATKDSSFTIKEKLNNWIKVTNDTTAGWILKNNIDFSIEEGNNSDNKNQKEETISVDTSKKGKVNVESARIRKLPNGDVLDSLSKDTEVIILSEENDWYQIKTDKYESCYIAKRLITEN